jgi:RecA/RadA recombinase
MALWHMTRDDLDRAPHFMQQNQQQQQQHDGTICVENTLSTKTVLRHIPTGLTSLDHQLRGGVRVGTITEIVGLTASAKSQMAMQLCIMAGIFLGQGSVYMDSEKKLSLHRLEEMAMSASRQHVKRQRHQQLVAASQKTTTTSSPPPPRRYQEADEDEEEQSFRHCRAFLANVSIHTPSTMEELFATLALVEDDVYLRNERAQEEEASLDRQQQYANTAAAAITSATTTATFPVRLLILDSIAAPARREFGSGSAPQRAATVMQCAQTLKRLADELQLAVIVLNQVDHASTTSSSSSSTSLLLQQQQQHRAALGTAWHHCVSTRIYLSSSLPPPLQQPPTDGDDRFGNNNNNNNSTALSCTTTQQEQLTRIPRLASVVKSNVTGPGRSVSFEVSTRGLVETMFPM